MKGEIKDVGIVLMPVSFLFAPGSFFVLFRSDEG